jgi:hypothetical protein
MYQFKHEAQREQKIFKMYIILFIISSLINVISFFIDGNIFRGIATLLFTLIVYHLGQRKNVWAVLIIKFIVWLHIILLIIAIISFLITW